jgi:hypothetical protein
MHKRSAAQQRGAHRKAGDPQARQKQDTHKSGTQEEVEKQWILCALPSFADASERPDSPSS